MNDNDKINWVKALRDSPGQTARDTLPPMGAAISARANALAPSDNATSRNRFAYKPRLSADSDLAELTEWLLWADGDFDIDPDVYGPWTVAEAWRCIAEMLDSWD